jgi:hypothetical protein
MVWQVEEHLLAMGYLLNGPNTEMVQGRTSQVDLGIVQCFLEERSELGQLVALIKEEMKEDFYFFHNVPSIRAQLVNT